MCVLAEKESIFFKILICSNERKLKILNSFGHFLLKDEKTTWPNDGELDYFISWIEGYKLDLAEMIQQEYEATAHRDSLIEEINANLELIHNPKQLNVILQWAQIGVEHEGGIKVENIYYLNHQHQENFLKLICHWEKSRIGDKEYLQACYILATPIIFDKLKDVWNNFKYPTTWIWEHLDGHSSVDLSSGMIQLGKLSLNLWNGYKRFNLMDCLSTLDNELYKVAIQAVHIRR